MRHCARAAGGRQGERGLGGHRHDDHLQLGGRVGKGQGRALGSRGRARGAQIPAHSRGACACTTSALLPCASRCRRALLQVKSKADTEIGTKDKASSIFAKAGVTIEEAPTVTTEKSSGGGGDSMAGLIGGIAGGIVGGVSLLCCVWYMSKKKNSKTAPIG